MRGVGVGLATSLLLVACSSNEDPSEQQSPVTGGDDSGASDCPAITAPRLSACAQWETPIPDAGFAPPQLSGVVTEVTPREWICTSPVHLVPPGSIGTSWTFRVSDGTGVLAVSAVSVESALLHCGSVRRMCFVGSLRRSATVL